MGKPEVHLGEGEAERSTLRRCTLAVRATLVQTRPIEEEAKVAEREALGSSGLHDGLRKDQQVIGIGIRMLRPVPDVRDANERQCRVDAVIASGQATELAHTHESLGGFPLKSLPMRQRQPSTLLSTGTLQSLLCAPQQPLTIKHCAWRKSARLAGFQQCEQGLLADKVVDRQMTLRLCKHFGGKKLLGCLF